MADAHSTNKKAPYKRRMTDKRRDQNRAAQKLYREKRKERLEQLERQVSILKDQGQTPNDDDYAQESSSSLALPSQLTIPELGDKQTAFSKIDDSTVAGLKYLLNAEYYWEDADVLLDFALREKPDIGKIIMTGLRALKLEAEVASEEAPCSSEIGQPYIWPERWVKPPLQLLPDPLADGILLRQQPILDVLSQNCQKIGLRVEDLMQYSCPSPWYSPFPSLPASLVPMETVPPDLYPTPAQRRFPHHPFIDLIPLPWLRERAVTLDSLDPSPFNRFEFKQDVISNGMICWKSRSGKEGLPWDRRSWEVQPWFSTKWGWLIEEQGRVEQQSRWWRDLRERRD